MVYLLLKLRHKQMGTRRVVINHERLEREFQRPLQNVVKPVSSPNRSRLDESDRMIGVSGYFSVFLSWTDYGQYQVLLLQYNHGRKVQEESLKRD